MDYAVLGEFLGNAGAAGAVACAGMGSALGTGAAAMAGIGAWKKCYAQNKAAPFMIMAFIGFPLTQTIYGLILKGILSGATENMTGMAESPVFLAAGILGGIAMGFSAMMQGRAAAGAADALAETGKGIGNYVVALGIVESVALFVMVFLLDLLPS